MTYRSFKRNTQRKRSRRKKHRKVDYQKSYKSEFQNGSDPNGDAGILNASKAVKNITARTIKLNLKNKPKMVPYEPVSIPFGEDEIETLLSYREHDGEMEIMVKFKYKSYHHVQWLSKSKVEADFVNFKNQFKKLKERYLDSSEAFDNPFNPVFLEVDRILDEGEIDDEVSSDDIKVYLLVKWRGLPYEESTWEALDFVQSYDPEAIKIFSSRQDVPEAGYIVAKERPKANAFVKLEESPLFKNDNKLRDYQLEGLNWSTYCWYHRKSFIIADEMGLGKKVQSIAFLYHIYRTCHMRGPFLVVAPVSTLYKWEREFNNWTDLNVIVFHGSTTSRNLIIDTEFYYKDVDNSRLSELYRFDVLITTYEVAYNSSPQLNPIQWQIGIFDEAHRLNNFTKKMLEVLKSYRLDHRVLLTDIPLQNSVKELFSLLNLLEPTQFDNVTTFLDKYGDLMLSSEVIELQSLLKPLMLCRFKKEVEESIPNKEETIIEVQLTNYQKTWYRAILERNFAWIQRGSKDIQSLGLNKIMMELRKCCNHPFLIKDIEEKIMADYPNYDDQQYFKMLIKSSGKLILLDKLLPKLKNSGHKVLIFSQLTKMLDLLGEYLAYRSYSYERIDNFVKGTDRQISIDRFSTSSDSFAFLLCTQTSGVGINLTAADTIIIFDSDWNPQSDLQAQYMVHRIEQTKPVKIYRLLCANTHECQMFDRANLELDSDKAVKQNMNSTIKYSIPTDISKKEAEDLLKLGAYGVLLGNTESERFYSEDIDTILQQRSIMITYGAREQRTTFSKASFTTFNGNPISLDDPHFWDKWAKDADIDSQFHIPSNLLSLDAPRLRKPSNKFKIKEYKKPTPNSNTPTINPTTTSLKVMPNLGISTTSSTIQTSIKFIPILPKIQFDVQPDVYPFKQPEARLEATEDQLEAQLEATKDQLETQPVATEDQPEIQLDTTEDQSETQLDTTDTQPEAEDEPDFERWQQSEVQLLIVRLMSFGISNWDKLRRGFLPIRTLKDLVACCKCLIARCFAILQLEEPEVDYDQYRKVTLKAFECTDAEATEVWVKDLDEQFTVNEDLPYPDATPQQISNYRVFVQELPACLGTTTRKPKGLIYRLRDIYIINNGVLTTDEDGVVHLFRKNVRIPNSMPKWWTQLMDRDLILGTKKHGFNAFTAIRKDPELVFSTIIFNSVPTVKRRPLINTNSDEDMEDFMEEEDEIEEESTGNNPEVPTTVQLNNPNKNLNNELSELKNWPDGTMLRNRIKRFTALYLKPSTVVKKAPKPLIVDSETIQQTITSIHSGNPVPSSVPYTAIWAPAEHKSFIRTLNTYGFETSGKELTPRIWHRFQAVSELYTKSTTMLEVYFINYIKLCLHHLDQTPVYKRIPGIMEYLGLFERLISTASLNSTHSTGTVENIEEIVRLAVPTDTMNILKIKKLFKHVYLLHILRTDVLTCSELNPNNFIIHKNISLPTWLNNQLAVELLQAIALYGLSKFDVLVLDPEFPSFFNRSVTAFPNEAKLVKLITYISNYCRTMRNNMRFRPTTPTSPLPTNFKSDTTIANKYLKLTAETSIDSNATNEYLNRIASHIIDSDAIKPKQSRLVIFDSPIGPVLKLIEGTSDFIPIKPISKITTQNPSKLKMELPSKLYSSDTEMLKFNNLPTHHPISYSSTFPSFQHQQDTSNLHNGDVPSSVAGDETSSSNETGNVDTTMDEFGDVIYLPNLDYYLQEEEDDDYDEAGTIE